MTNPSSRFDQLHAFDSISSEKWGLHPGKDILPLWVADMDFAAPPAVLEALQQRLSQGVLGYTNISSAYKEAVAAWMGRRHGWEVDPRWIRFCPGVVTSLGVIIRACTSPGDRIVIQPPVYPPFHSIVSDNGRELALNPLLLDSDGTYRINFDELEEMTADGSVKMLILCHPHNPVGRVWSRAELDRLSELCLSRGILVVSDEIHGDLVHGEEAFVPYASLSAAAASRSVICTAPSKSFNIAGLNTSNIIVSDDGLRSQITEELRRCSLGSISVFGYAAAKAAYREGEEWLEEALAYIRSNLAYVASYIEEHIPEISVKLPEGTYLLWLDCSGLGMQDADLHRFFLDEARLQLSAGTAFGSGGAGHMRLNAACPRSILEEAMSRLDDAVRRLRSGQLAKPE